MEKEIKVGIYKHFKGNEYQVVDIGTHSETLEPYVVYRALYGEKSCGSDLQICFWKK